MLAFGLLLTEGDKQIFFCWAVLAVKANIDHYFKNSN
jgi:hypothetical protein